MSEEGEGLKEHLAKKYGASAAASFGKPDSPLIRMGEKVGIHFNNDRKMQNTIKAHILVEYLNEKGDIEKANELMEHLYEAYFVNAENINSVEVLSRLGSRVGLEPSVVQELVSDTARREAILYADHQAKRQLRVSGVPFFIIGDEDQRQPVAFSGAQPVSVISEVLLEAAEE